MLSRRRLFRLLPAGGCGLLAACGEKTDERPDLTEYQESLLNANVVARAAASRPSGLVLPSKPLTVAYVHSPWGAQGNQYKSFLKQAGAGGAEIVRLEAEPMPSSGDFTFGELLSGLPESKAVDLIVFPVSQLEDLEANECLTPLDKISHLSHLLDENDYWGDSLSAGQIQGRQMAIPLMLGPWLLMYNRGRLEQYGISPPGSNPWAFELFSENVTRMTNSAGGGGRPDAFGFVQLIPSSSGGTPVPPSWVWLTSSGVILPNRDGGEGALTSPESIDALSLMRGLAFEQRTVYTIPTNNPWRQMRGILSDRNIGMMSFPTNSGWFLTAWRRQDVNRTGFDLAALPGGRRHRTPTEIHMMVGLSARTKEPDAAVLGLTQIHNSIGAAMFPTAMKADVERMKQASQDYIREIDVEALERALAKSRMITLTDPDRNLLVQHLDRPMFLDGAEPEDAAEAARTVLEDQAYIDMTGSTTVQSGNNTQ